MREEKNVKHWLKRKVTFTQALLVAFFITGGILGAVTEQEFSDLKAKVAELEKYKVKFVSVKVDKEGESIGNSGNKGAGQDFSVAVGPSALAGREYSISIGTYVHNAGKYSAAIGTWMNPHDMTFNLGEDDHRLMLSNIFGSFNRIYVNEERQLGGNLTSLDKQDGMDNLIMGNLNYAADTNGAYILGSGNIVRNSLLDFKPFKYSTKPEEEMKTMQETGEDIFTRTMNYRKEMKKYGGRTTILGKGNEINGATRVSIQGFGNIVRGDVIDGMPNEDSPDDRKDTLNKAAENILIMGDNHKLTKVSNAIILGSSDKETETTVSDIVAIGHNAQVKNEGGIAMGNGSSSTTDKGKQGFDPSTNAVSAKEDITWKSTRAALSVGDVDNKITRQITGVAAGSEDTDAVNVAQLKALNQKMGDNKVHYYSVNDYNGSLKMLGNYENDDAKGIASMAVGIGSSVRIGNGFQGATANTFGTLNTIDATGGNTFDGVANSVVGVANTTKNANGVLVFGAGNLVKNAYEDVNLNIASLNPTDPESMTKALAGAVKDSGGDILAIGGANEVDYAKFSQVVGVGNILKGASGKESNYALLNGYKNEATNVENTYVTGKDNTVEEAEDNLVTGKNLSLKGKEGEKAKGNILFGFNDEKKDNVIKESAKNIVAIGNNIVANMDHSVYLGNDSTEATPDVTKGINQYEKETIENHIYTFQGIKPVGIVSVGKVGGERRIENVAAGYIDKNSTDAINGSQLFATNSKMGKFMNSTKTILGGNAEVNKETGEVKMTDIGGTGKNTLHEAIAEVKKIAGDTAAAASKTSVSVEEELTVTKTETKDPATQKVTNTDYKVGLSKAVKDKLNKIGDGVIAKDGEKSEHTVTGKTVYDYLEQQKKDIGVDLSNKANKDGSNIEVDKFTKKLNEGADIATPKDRLVTDRQVKEYVAGTEIAYKAEGESESKKVKLSDGFVFQGDKNIQTKTEANGVVKHTLNSDLTGIKSISNEGTTITLNKAGVSVNDKKITGIADGEISSTSTDAITGKQLHATNERVKTLETENTIMKEHIVDNAKQIQNVKGEVRHVGALSSALAALHPMQYDPRQKNQVMAGVGTYRDKQAVAVGLTHYFNENLMMTAGVSVGEAERVKTMANVGITWKIGKDEDRKDLPERYQEGPISSIYKMQQEMETVLKENEELKSAIKNQEKISMEQEKANKEQNEKIQRLEKQLEILLKK